MAEVKNVKKLFKKTRWNRTCSVYNDFDFKVVFIDELFQAINVNTAIFYKQYFIVFWSSGFLWSFWFRK